MTFVNRQAELAALAEELERVRQGPSRIVLIAGEAGIGKTALVRHFIEQAGDEVGVMLWGSTPIAAGEQIAYAPIVEILDQVRRHHADVLAELGAARVDLDPLLPSEGERVVTRTQGDPNFARIHLLDTLRVLLESLAAKRPPLVVVVDDLQWADDAMLDAFSFLAYRLRASPVLLLGCYRSDLLASRPVLERLLIELVRLEWVAHMRLRGLAIDDLRLVAPPELGRRRISDIARRSGGNPYFFTELIEAAAEEGEALPSDLFDVLSLRLRSLPPSARRVAQVAAVTGRQASGRLIETVVSAPAQEVMSALQLLVQAGVLEPPTSPDSGYAFRTPLMQEAILHEVLPDERARFHRAVAAVLEHDPGLGPAGPAGVVTLALHWAEADDPVRALPALLAGAEAAAHRYAFELAHAFLERALATDVEQAVAGRQALIGFRPATFDDPIGRRELLLRAAEMAHLAGRHARAVELARMALASGEGSPARHLVMERIGSYELDAGNAQAAVDAFKQSVTESATGGDEDRARILASYGRALMLLGRYSKARATLEDAVACADRASTIVDKSRALRTLGSVLARTGDGPGGEAKLAEAAALDEGRGQSLIAPRPSRIGYIIGGLLDRAADLALAGSTAAASSALKEAEEATQQLGGVAAWGGLVTGAAARELFLLGRWSELQELLEEDVAIAAAPVHAELDIIRARLAAARGELEQAIDQAARAGASISDATSTIRADLAQVLAEIALWQNRPEDARDAVEQALSELTTTEDDLAVLEAVAVGLRADRRRLELARLRRSPGEAAAIREDALLLAARARVTPSSLSTRHLPGRAAALRSLCEAELSTLVGVMDRAAWDAAVAAFEALHEPFRAAHTRWQEAELLLEQRHERAQAERLLRSAYDVATQLGATGLRVEIEALAQRARIDLRATSVEDEPRHEDELSALRRQLGLSAREIEVLALVARGRTNRQIADELFITEKTAGHHVSNILTKLTLSSRVEAAAVAHRVGLLAVFEAIAAS